MLQDLGFGSDSFLNSLVHLSPPQCPSPSDFDHMDMPGTSSLQSINAIPGFGQGQANDQDAYAADQPILAQGIHTSPENWLDSDRDTADRPLTSHGTSRSNDSNDLSTAGSSHYLSRSHTSELLNYFFAHLHPMLPTFHVASFKEEIASQGPGSEASPALLAVLTLASSQHFDCGLNTMASKFSARADRTISKAWSRHTVADLRLLQAMIWMAFQASLEGDFTKSWSRLSNAWTVASSLGFNHLDDLDLDPFIDSSSCRHSEEIRKTTWALVSLDRGLFCLSDRPLVVDDRQFTVSPPMKDSDFQQNSVQVSPKYTTNILLWSARYTNQP